MLERLTVALDSRGDVFTQALVDVQHVQVDAAKLHYEGVADSLAGSDVCLEDAAQLTHRLRIFQDVHVLKEDTEVMKPYFTVTREARMWTQEHCVSLTHLCCLLDDAVPHLVGQQHVLLYEDLLDGLVSLGSDHVANSFVEGVDLRDARSLW